MGRKRKSDFFIHYISSDLEYEFKMLSRCVDGISMYEHDRDQFLYNLCIEGWLLHARRIIESFKLEEESTYWKRIWADISNHLSHARPKYRKDKREEMRKNPKWFIKDCHYKLLKDINIVAERYKDEYPHYDLLISLLA